MNNIITAMSDFEIHFVKIEKICENIDKIVAPDKLYWSPLRDGTGVPFSEIKQICKKELAELVDKLTPTSLNRFVSIILNNHDTYDILNPLFTSTLLKPNTFLCSSAWFNEFMRPLKMDDGERIIYIFPSYPTIITNFGNVYVFEHTDSSFCKVSKYRQEALPDKCIGKIITQLRTVHCFTDGNDEQFILHINNIIGAIIDDFKRSTEKNVDMACCGVCYLKNHDRITLVPCGHCNVCSSCYDKFSKKECPFCRVPVTAVIKLKCLD